jgi:CCR4-NOT transcription complex subunit 9
MNQSGIMTDQSGNMAELYPLVLQLTKLEHRETALLELSKRRENFPELAPVLWHSFGTISALLQEIISIYPMLSPPLLSPQASNRVCNALALLQCVASHPETKPKLMAAHIPLYLYPFLNTVSRHRPFEYLRLTSLGVIGALVKVDDTEVVNFLLQTEIIPLCLRIMETGSELSKTVATFIVQKILLDQTGLSYVCATPERFYAVNNVLSSMVTKLLTTPSVRLLKHVVRCYLRLSENVRARDALRQNLPEVLRDNSFANVLRSEEIVQRWLAHLQKNLSDDREPTGPTNGEGSLNPLNNPSNGLPPTVPGGLGQNKSAWSGGLV